MTGAYLSTGEVFVDPMTAGSATAPAWRELTSSEVDLASDFPYRHPSFGYNMRGIGGENWPLYTQYPFLQPARQVEISKPGDTIILTDSLFRPDPVFGGYYVVDGVFTSEGPHAAHDDAVDVLWGDGHADANRVADPADTLASDPFRFGNQLGHPENRWDRE